MAAVRHHHPAADLPAGRAAPAARHHRPPAAARRPPHGPVRAPRSAGSTTGSAHAAARSRQHRPSAPRCGRSPWSARYLPGCSSSRTWHSQRASRSCSRRCSRRRSARRAAALSHGSAIVGTVQQVAGAAGTAPCSSRSWPPARHPNRHRRLDRGRPVGGLCTAFMVGAILSVVAVVGAFFVRRPADMTRPPAPTLAGSRREA